MVDTATAMSGWQLPPGCGSLDVWSLFAVVDRVKLWTARQHLRGGPTRMTNRRRATDRHADHRQLPRRSHHNRLRRACRARIRWLHPAASSLRVRAGAQRPLTARSSRSSPHRDLAGNPPEAAISSAHRVRLIRVGKPTIASRLHQIASPHRRRLDGQGHGLGTALIHCATRSTVSRSIPK
jgi:hypothetical protein